MKKMICPTAKNTRFCLDGYIRVGKYVIGEWSKEVIGGGFHFRPSPNEGRTCYYANIYDGPTLSSFCKHDLYSEIEDACKDGVEWENDD